MIFAIILFWAIPFALIIAASLPDDCDKEANVKRK